MTRKNLVDSPTMLRPGDKVQDGRATTTIKQINHDGRWGCAELLLEYDDGGTIWLQENRFVFDENAGGWVVE